MPDDPGRRRNLVLAAQARARRLVGALGDELAQLIDSTDNVSTDDEHDPDGSTSGYERAKATSLLDGARSRLCSLDEALDRLDEGAYGVCRTCGGDIAPERLEALPEAETCIACARRSPRRFTLRGDRKRIRPAESS